MTKTCEKKTAHFSERTVNVIDTPGIFDTSIMEGSLKNEIENCIMLSVPGPHVFLLVIRLDVRFTEEEKNAVQWIKDNFGEEAAQYTMVLFTRGDMLKKKSIENYLDQSPELRELISDCRAGYTVFDNTCKKNRIQVADLFEKIDNIVHLNGNHYTSNVYEEVQKKIERKKWWSKCGDTLTAASNYLMVGAAFAAARAAGAAEEVAAATMRSVVMMVGAGVIKVLGEWMKPKP